MRSTSRVVAGLPSDPPLKKKKEEEDDVLHFSVAANARGFRRNPRHRRRALRTWTRAYHAWNVFSRSVPSQSTELAARPGEFSRQHPRRAMFVECYKEWRARFQKCLKNVFGGKLELSRNLSVEIMT
jgi:hypothetical protein